MKRDISKALEQYEKLPGNGRALYADDIRQIDQIAKERNHGSIYDAICVAFEAGYAIGFRQANRKRTGSKEEA